MNFIELELDIKFDDMLKYICFCFCWKEFN